MDGVLVMTASGAARRRARTATSGTVSDALPSVIRIAEPQMTDPATETLEHDSATEIHEPDSAIKTTTREGPHNDLPSADVHP